MSTASFKTDTDIAREHVSSDEYVNVLSDCFSVVVLFYKPAEHKLCYNAGQLLNGLGYNKDQNNDTFDVFDIIHQGDIAALNNALSTFDKTEACFDDFNCRLLRQDGSYRNYRFQCRMHDKNGASPKVILLGFDIEKQVTADTTSSDKAINDLKLINRELEDFAYAASHDLQEPLRKIITFSTRLAEKCKDNLEEDGSMYLDRIMASAGNMRVFIDNLLEFSRLSRVTASVAPTDLNFIFQQIKTDLDLAIEETKTQVRAVKLPTIQASPTQMKQLFMNIISNAIKFRREDAQSEISISCKILDESAKSRYHLLANTTYYQIDIKDNGIGFDEEYAAKIFKIFQRLHGKSEYPGSGIGLAICKKIVDQHKGLIFANSIKGQGTTFSIILPEALK